MIDDAWTRDAAKALRLGGPHCAHLLTTRDQAIARSFGTVQSVEVLDPDPARRLLAELAPITAQPKGDGPDLVAQLLAAVGYLPLAIRLMGGYLNGENGGEPVAFAQQARTVLARLADPATRPGSVAERLNATIALSLDGAAQADPAARTVFHALGAFAPKPARFDLAAAQAVTQAEPATLARLIQRNLLEKGPDESLALHQTLAAFARTATRDESVTRHRDHYLELVEQDEEDWQAIEAMYEQILWAWRYCPDDETKFRFTSALGTFQKRRGFLTEEIGWINQCLRIARDSGNASKQAMFCNNLGWPYSVLGDKGKALTCFKEALALCRQMGNKSGEATALNNMGMIYDGLGEKEKALTYYEEALALFRQVGDKAGEATTLLNIGAVYPALGETGKALTYYEEALALFRQVGDKSGEATTLNNMGRIHDDLDEKEKALTYYEEALPLLRKIGDKAHEAGALNNIGAVYDDLGEKEMALTYYEEALPLRRQVGDKTGEATTLSNIGMVYDDLGEKGKALMYYEEALPLQRQVGDKSGEATTLNNIGMLYDDLGEKQKAVNHLNKALGIFMHIYGPDHPHTRLVRKNRDQD